MLSTAIQSAIASVLSKHLGKSVSINYIKPVGGGCINHSVWVTTTAGDFFVKVNDARRYPQMFEAEAKGLQLLAAANTIKIPEVIACGKTSGESFIVLEYIQPGARSHKFWENFGESLANLHRITAPRFGLDHDNYIGSLPQSNTQHVNWVSFFIHERLQKQVALATDSQLLTSMHLKQFERLYTLLPALFPKESPALLHGDLWSGNFITATNGEACLVDPAVYYGSREMELAFTQLFGGFHQRFYAAYQAAFPLHPGFSQRVDLYNLYPLLVHLNLFGRSYLGQIQAVVGNFQ